VGAGRLRWVAIAAAIAWTISAEAQGQTSLQAGALLTIQPTGYGNASPYLDNGVGGVQPGISVGLEHRTSGGMLLALELSSTRSMHATQSGRLVFRESGAPCGPFSGSGCGPIASHHRDTLLTALVGRRFAWDEGGIEPKLGGSLIIGTPKQGSFPIEDAAGRFAFTAGLDVTLRLSDRVELVPSVRYSRAFRDENDFYVGIGSNIFRIGLGVRFGLSRR
jgi:hypothetical protein